MQKRKRLLAFGLPLALVAVIVALWYFTDLRVLSSPERVAAAVGSLRTSRVAIWYVLGAFALGTTVFFPITALIVGTTLAFDGMRGFIYAFIGTLLAAVSTYWSGRMLGSRAIDDLQGRRISKVTDLLRARAFRASIVARVLPVGNFTAINMLAGSMRVPFVPFFFGNAVGVLPGILVLTVFSDRLLAALRAPDAQTVTQLVIGLCVLAGLLVALKRWNRRRGVDPG